MRDFPSIAPGPMLWRALLLAQKLPREPLAVNSKMFRRYGDVVRLTVGTTNSYLIRRPEHVKHVLLDNHRNYNKQNMDYRLLKPIVGEGLLTSDGDLWRRQRALIQPAFRPERIDGFVPLMVEQAEKMLLRWRRAGTQTLDVSQECSRLTLETVAQSLFGLPIGDRATIVRETFLVLARHVLQQFSPLAVVLRHLPTAANRSAAHARKRLHRVVDQLIEQRGHLPPGDDLLSQMMQACGKHTDEPMHARQLRDEVSTLLLAGHDTTANALSWTFYLLSLHSDVRDRLEDEVDCVLGNGGLTASTLGRLRYARAVFQESMRLYPPAWVFSRSAIAEDEIGGFRIERGSLVALCAHETHRLPDCWPAPGRFDPERFLGSRGGPAPFEYYPFGGGPRRCVGATMALTEAVCVLAAVAWRCRLNLVPGHPVVPEALITLRPRYGVRMRVEWRRDGI